MTPCLQCGHTTLLCHRCAQEKYAPKKLTVVFGEDDWEGVYVDGKLFWQGHHIDYRTLAQALKVKVQVVAADGEWLGIRGELPENLDEVKRKERG